MRPHFDYTFGVLSGDIVLLTDVILQIIQVDSAILAAFDQLEITLANGATRACINRDKIGTG